GTARSATPDGPVTPSPERRAGGGAGDGAHTRAGSNPSRRRSRPGRGQRRSDAGGDRGHDRRTGDGAPGRRGPHRLPVVRRLRVRQGVEAVPRGAVLPVV